MVVIAKSSVMPLCGHHGYTISANSLDQFLYHLYRCNNEYIFVDIRFQHDDILWFNVLWRQIPCQQKGWDRGRWLDVVFQVTTHGGCCTLLQKGRWAISLLLCTNELRKFSSRLEGASFLALQSVDTQSSWMCVCWSRTLTFESSVMSGCGQGHISAWNG